MQTSFKDLINGDKPVLVDFFAEWCGPCKMMTPILHELSKKVGDKVKIVKIDVDKNSTLAANMGVMGVPTLMLFNKGKQVWSRAGVSSAPQLEAIINENLN
ncbi:MAG: thioredoxin [Saprospiraceae bacterium]|nr:thioredoxin [Saprospiraceae bacterium]